MFHSAAGEIPVPLTILGVKVSPFTSYDHAISCISSRISRGLQSFCVAINPEKVYRALNSPELRAVLEQSEIGICDGIGISIAARILHGARVQRCTGIDLFERLTAAAAKEGWSVFLLGASSEVNRRAAEVLTRLHPSLVIAGRHDGYFSSSDRIVADINASGADLLFVAMGSPRQEFWIAKHRSELRVKLCMGVGGTLDVISGAAPRAPRFYRRTGTEFLYRLILSPSRWRRQILYPLFMFKVLQERLLASRSNA